MACHAHTPEISERRNNNLPECPMKDSRSWSHMSTRTADGNYLKKLLHKQRREGKEAYAYALGLGLRHRGLFLFP